MASPTTAGTVALLGAVAAGQIGLLALFNLFGTTTTTEAPGVVQVPTCPPCPTPGCGLHSVACIAVISLLCGAGLVALTPFLPLFVAGCALGYFSGKAHQRESSRALQPYRREPGESDSE